MKLLFPIWALTFAAHALTAAAQGTQVQASKPKTLNFTGCNYDCKACCVCVNEVMPKALRVTLTGQLSEGKKIKVVLDQCDYRKLPGPLKDVKGPRFDKEDGPRFKDRDNDGKLLECSPSGKVYFFNIHGGPVPGEYKVLLVAENKSDPDTAIVCEECGTICVHPPPPPPNPAGGNPINLGAGKFGFPPKVDMDALRLLTKNRHIPYQGPYCAPVAGFRIGPDIPNTPYSLQQKEDPPNSNNWVDFGIIYNGKSSTAPGVGAATARRFEAVPDTCGNRLELFCSINFELWFVDCHNNYYRVGECLFPEADNLFQVRFSEQCNKRHFQIIDMENRNLAVGANDVNHYVFHTCARRRTASKQTRNAQGELPSTPGEQIAGFPLVKVPVEPESGPPPP